MNPTTQCPIHDLQSFVDDSLSSRRSDQIISHLDECAECRQRVDRLAGSAEDWAVAAEAFSAEEMELRPSESGFGTTQGSTGEVVHRFDVSLVLGLLAPSDDPRAAGRIGPFEVTGIVGSGGMAVVLKAREPSLDRYVAIKMLSPHLASSKSARKRFARESRAAAAVIHENVIAIYQVGHWNDVPYLVMPYLPDPSLQQRIDVEGPLGVEQTLSIAMQIARGLSAAHSQGLVHRDVKPANVLLSKGTERAVITDFGLARAADDASLTRAGVLAGTPHYMSPEQARGEPVDARSDLFSLGSVLFTMLAGRPPAEFELGSETITQIASHPLPSLCDSDVKVPTWLTRLVDWLHQRDPKRRPRSAEEVADLLEQCLLHCRQPDQNELPDRLVDSRRVANRSTLLVGGIVVSLALIGLGMHYAWRNAAARESVVEPVHGVVEDPRGEIAGIEIDRIPHNESSQTTQTESTTVGLGWREVEEQVAGFDRDLQQLEVRFEKDWDQKQ